VDIVIAVGQSVAVAAADGVHGFASALTSFVGRAEAMGEVAGLLAECRLVTVTGPGGSGKTRLATEVARRVAGRFADGVWLVELAAVRDPAQVPAAVTAALEVGDLPGIPMAAALARVLAARQLLLVLDNCEHVIDAAAQLCAGLLPLADELRVLATSREPLRVAGEARYRLAPLTLPGADDQALTGSGPQSEAVTLFADRARRAGVRLALDGPANPAVARLVTRLDGMPLAIELAAARVEALGVTELLDRLGDRFDLLTAGDRLAVGRHRSLAATVEWSYQLLDERERRVFRAVSVFPAGFTLEAAEAVAGADAGLAVLHLVDCSLLVPPRVDPDGRSRYVMLETLRAYGDRLLTEAGEQGQAGAALAGHALGVAELAAVGLRTGSGELAAARWLDAEEATMRQALAWALQHDADTAVRLAVALVPWCFLRGRLTSEYPVLRQAAAHAEPGSDMWCTAQFWLGWSALYAGDPVGALGHFTEVCDAVGDGPPRPALADCLAGRAAALASQGRAAEAIQDGRRAMSMARELGYPAGEGTAILALGLVAGYTDDMDAALQLTRQAEQIAAEIPGWIARTSSGMQTAVLTAAGDLDGAERSCAAGLALARDVGDLQSLAAGLTHLVILDLLAGRIRDAAAHVRELLQVSARTGSPVDALNGLDCCGQLCAATGRAAEAVTLWAAYAALLQHDGFTDAPVDTARRDEPLRRARQALGEDGARAAEDRGAAMSLATAAEYALMLATPGPQPQAPPGLAGLSTRECELVTLVARGRTDAQIAAELFISVRTVSSHLDRIRDKTGARRRADLTRLALTAGLV
jgi:predicted ATPase/DNA-binding CsgD family transcriptional regulator